MESFLSVNTTKWYLRVSDSDFVSFSWDSWIFFSSSFSESWRGIIIHGEIITQRGNSRRCGRDKTHTSETTRSIRIHRGGCNVVSALGSAVCGFGTSDGTRRTTHCRSYPRKLSRGRIVSRSICTQPHCSWRARPRVVTQWMYAYVCCVKYSRARVSRGKAEGTCETSEALTDSTDDFSRLRWCSKTLVQYVLFSW